MRKYRTLRGRNGSGRKDRRRLRPRSEVFSWDDEIVMVPELTVYDDDDSEDTGLLDAAGNKLYRVIDKVPMGFHLET